MVLRGQDAWRRHPIFRWTFTDAFPAPHEEEGHHGHGAHGAAAHGSHGAAAVQPHH
jgi:hypothetical protein